VRNAMTLGKPAKRGDSAETRTRILNAALALFRKQGFEQTTMRQIATESGMALGAAYYYFPSKEAIVMAFYERAQEEMSPFVKEALGAKSLERRLSALLEVKFKYFQANRNLLGALSRHIDPRHPLSPFSDETRLIRDKDIEHFIEVVEGSDARVPPDLKPHLPRLLWLYQMGLLLFWVYDPSREQVRTKELVEKSLSLVALLIKFASFPLFRPIRRRAVDLLLTVGGEPSSPGRKEET
jgi:AcrR family transcriptional regulator